MWVVLVCRSCVVVCVSDIFLKKKHTHREKKKLPRVYLPIRLSKNEKIKQIQNPFCAQLQFYKLFLKHENNFSQINIKFKFKFNLYMSHQKCLFCVVRVGRSFVWLCVWCLCGWCLVVSVCGFCVCGVVSV